MAWTHAGNLCADAKNIRSQKLRIYASVEQCQVVQAGFSHGF